MVLTEEQKMRVAYILQKGKSVEGQISKLEAYLRADEPDPMNAKMRYDSLAVLYKEYLKYNDELTQLDANNPQLTNFLEVESRYFEVASNVMKLQKTESIANSTLNSTSIVVTDRQVLPRLPEIKVPVFDGTVESWANFKNKFTTLIHDRTDISDAVKCSHLFASLSGKALDKVSHFDPSERDYQRAWQTMLDFFDQKRIVAVQHLNAIIELPKLSSATADGLASLVDKARQHLHILDSLGATNRDDLVVRLIERCLPSATASRWQDRLEMNELPKLEDLFQFLQHTTFKLQALETSVDRNPKKRGGEIITHGQSKNSKPNARTFMTASTSATTSSSSLRCPKCNQGHRLYKCPSFEKLLVQERWDFVRSNKLCRNCFGFHALPCKSDRRCKICNRNHHSLLHNEKIAESQQVRTHSQGFKSKDENSSKSTASSS